MYAKLAEHHRKIHSFDFYETTDAILFIIKRICVPFAPDGRSMVRGKTGRGI